ncbi:unnamed protein product [Pseudo-nitzschia multistriata]|uniref:Uncharacterized protein n=1 Tax=Pseudo-nitzschia multistriata TaxID=183589 RepID=A0A448Z7F5_9STRA|nr:unnamed protein product [Pseudo-nitzschia multistriata]
MTSVSTGAPTNYVFPAAHGLHLDENGATGPTTRSRKRSPQAIGTIERRTEAEPDNSTSDPTEISRKRRRTASRKKPPPGAALKKPPAGASCKKRSVNDTEEKPTAEVVNCLSAMQGKIRKDRTC